MSDQPQPIITGVVRDAAGQPVAEASVYYAAAPVAMPDVALLTGEDGTFTLAAPAPGRYRLGVAAAGYASGEVDVEVGAEPARAEVVLQEEP